jgi:hypothetical protein
MTDQQSTKPNLAKNVFLIYALPAILIASCAWRLLIPAHEYPGRSSMILDMVIDAALLIGMFGIRANIPKPLFWIAVVAGIGLFAIRMHSDASWWTGHWSYSLSPR